MRGVVAEDFCNYKLPSMFISTAFCDWKCCTEQGVDIGVCQNAPLATQEIMDAPVEVLYNLYHNNDITKAVVLGGLEPILQADEILDLIRYFRLKGENCPFVIYTGYYPDEIQSDIMEELRALGNVIVKFGRYIQDSNPRYDSVLGITLASENQFARELDNEDL